MNCFHKIILLACASVIALSVSASPLVADSLSIDARLGLSAGGTAPTSMPAEVRRIEAFRPGWNPTLAIEANYSLPSRWGIHTGLRFERKGMDVDVRMKNFDVDVVRGGEVMQGSFIGKVRVKVAQYMFTLPLQASYDVNNKVRLRLGPYFSLVTGRKFEGWAYDGYLRVDGPTGAKVELGSEPGSRGDYDFPTQMRRFQWGVDAGVDWQFSQRFGAFADVTWALNGVFKSNFTTVPMTLHGLYCTIGVSYQLK